MLESKYQSKVIKRLEAQGYYVIKLIQTNKAGIPDLLALKRDEILFVEVKGEKTPISPIQEYRHQELRLNGFKVKIDRYDSKANTKQ